MVQSFVRFRVVATNCFPIVIQFPARFLTWWNSQRGDNFGNHAKPTKSTTLCGVAWTIFLP